MNKSTLIYRQRLPLEVKVKMFEIRLRKFYEENDGQIYVPVSGKDSTVGLHMARKIYPGLLGVYVDTGLEYPEVRKHIRSLENVKILRPEMSFKDVISEYGYPVASKKVSRAIRDLKNPTEKNWNTRNLYLTGYTRAGHYCPSRKLAKKWYPLIEAGFKCSEQCCKYLKHGVMEKWERKLGLKPVVCTMADEGGTRENEYLKHGCFPPKGNKANIMGYFTEQDVLEYIVIFDVPIPSVYGEIEESEDGLLFTTGERRTGCMFCMFGVDQESEPNRFQRMKLTHPKQYKYAVEDLGIGEVLKFIGVPY